VPNGFRLKWTLDLEADEDLIMKCEKIKKDASLKLISIAIETCDRFLRKQQFVNFGQGQSEVTECRLNQTAVNLKRTKNKKFRDIKVRDKFLNNSANTEIPNPNIIKVQSDGNCYYRCVSRFLYDTEHRHTDIRIEIVRYMNNNRSVFEQLVDGDFEEHMRHQMMSDGQVQSWATEAELFATARLYNITIIVENAPNSSDKDLIIKPQNAKSTDKAQTMNLRLMNNHFDLVQKITTNEHSEKFKKLTEESFEKCAENSYVDWFEVSSLQDNLKGNNTTCVKNDIDEINLNKQKIKTNFGEGNSSNNGEKSVVQEKQSKKRTVINISNKILSQAEISILEKGLSFVPSANNIDITKLHSDLIEWERRMRLREYFYEKEDKRTGEEEEWQKKESSFTPEQGRDKWLDEYISTVKTDILNHIKTKILPNLTKTERNAIDSLLKDNSIVIRPADKGSGIVIMDTDQYMERLDRELSQDDTYQQTDGNAFKIAEKKVRNVANEMYKSGLINKELKNYLIPKYSKNGKLKGNPKVHKNGHPMRTIVNGKGTPTENMAGIAEKELEEYVTNTPSYIQDTTDFLNKIENYQKKLDKNTILFCFDVVKLYPSIPKDDGLKESRKALETRKYKKHSTESVMKMIETVLENNLFEFNGKEYCQRNGVAIGSKLGKNFACTFMRHWDEELGKHEKQPSFYKRFIDDGFGIWEHGAEELIKFQQYANSIHNKIKVELRWDYNKIEFLDTMVIKDRDGSLYTDLYSKPTDKHQYLQFKSSHPNNMKKSLPYGLGIRIRRICSKENDYKRRRQELKMQLRKRGYSGKFIESQLTKVDRLDRRDLLKYRQKQNKQDTRVPLVVTFKQQLPNISEIVRKHMKTLYKSEKMQRVFSSPPIVSYRRDTNIGDILVHGKLNKIARERGEIQRLCCKTVCKGCQGLQKGAITYSTQPQNQKCQLTNVIYGLTCSDCEKIVYVGETGRAVAERYKEHEADIRLKRDKAVPNHFNQKGHSGDSVGVVVLERIRDNSRYYRKLREMSWIKQLETEAPDGINTKTDLGVLWNKTY
jgi:hypothetical protein